MSSVPVEPERSIVKVCGADSAVRGTGFFISAEGHVLTCHHVVAGLAAIFLERDGFEATARLDLERSAPELDLAVLISSKPPPAVAPVDYAWQPGEAVWTAGFQLQSTAIRDALPTRGSIAGTTRLAYQAGERVYEVEALRLEGALVDSGLSGAPVVLEDGGVAVGIMGASLRQGGGFVLGFGSAPVRASGLFPLLEANRESVPRCGRFLNWTGLRLGCRSQIEKALAGLSRTRQILPDLYFPRSAAEAEVRGFLDGEQRILPLVGLSGTGKTQLLAEVARRLAESRPAVLLPGYLLDARDRSLAETLAAELCAAAPELGPPDRLAGQLTELSRSHPGELVVLLDGLNELQSPAPVVRAWLQRSGDWLGIAQARLIVSSRPEAWKSARGWLGLTSERDDEKPSLAELTSEEAARAAKAYGLPPRLREAPVFRHPLMVRMYWEARGDEADAEDRLGYHDLFSRFLAAKIKSARDRLDRPPSELLVQTRLAALGKMLQDRPDLWIDPAEYFALFPGDSDLADALLAEHLVVEGVHGIRLAFDEVASFLIAKAFDLSHDPTPEEWEAWRRADSPILPVVPFLVARLEADGKPGSLRRWLEAQVRFQYKEPPYAYYETLLMRCFQGMRRPQDHFDLMQAWASHLLESWRTEGTFHDRVLPLVTSLDLSLEQRLGILRLLVQDQHYYDWEPKHWRRLTREQFWDRNLGHDAPLLLWQEVQQATGQTIEILLEWLGDPSPLSSDGGPSSTARLGDLAAGMLFHAFSDQTAVLAEALLRHRGPGAEWLCRVLCEEKPAAMLDVFEARAREGPQLDEQICQMAKSLVEALQDEDRVRRLATLLDTCLGRGVSDNGRNAALGVLARMPWRQDQVVEGMIEAMRTGPRPFPVYDLKPLLESHFDRLVPELERLMCENPASEGESILSLLSDIFPDPDRGPRVLRVIREARNVPRLTYWVAFALETGLSRCDVDSPLFSDLYSQAVDFLQVTPPTSSLAPLCYAAQWLLEQPEKREIGFRLAREILHKNDSDLAGRLLEALVRSSISFDEAFPFVHAAAEIIDGEPSARSLLRPAMESESFRDGLIAWVLTQDEAALGRGMIQLRHEIESGTPPKEAVWNAAVSTLP
jgi:hypothetical protein